MTTPLRLGVAGLGTVGSGVIGILQRHADLLASRAGRPIEITAVCARDRTRNREVQLDGYEWEESPVALAGRNDIDVLVELIGGADGPAKVAVETAISNGRDVVTANKAMLAHHGQILAETAESAGAALRFEAAVAGGIPVVKTLTEGLASNQIIRVMGVMNGTCNYILTRMQSAGLTYQEAFSEADGLGYLEADPNLDVGGIDAGHKLALLSAIAFGAQVDFGGVEVEGISRITIEDIHQSADMGFRIKLLGVARITERGLEQRMSPCLVPADSPLGQLEGGTNMVVLEGDSAGQIVLRGAGAGPGPTASAVVSDIIDLARGVRIPTFGRSAHSLRKVPTTKSASTARYYVRMQIQDRPGALAEVAGVLGDASVSIDRMRQYRHDAATAPVLFVTHKTNHEDLETALSGMETTDVIEGKPVAIRIEEV